MIPSHAPDARARWVALWMPELGVRCISSFFEIGPSRAGRLGQRSAYLVHVLTAGLEVQSCFLERVRDPRDSSGHTPVGAIAGDSHRLPRRTENHGSWQSAPSMTTTRGTSMRGLRLVAAWGPLEEESPPLLWPWAHLRMSWPRVPLAYPAPQPPQPHRGLGASEGDGCAAE